MTAHLTSQSSAPWRNWKTYRSQEESVYTLHCVSIKNRLGQLFKLLSASRRDSRARFACSCVPVILNSSIMAQILSAFPSQQKSDNISYFNSLRWSIGDCRQQRTSIQLSKDNSTRGADKNSSQIYMVYSMQQPSGIVKPKLKSKDFIQASSCHTRMNAGSILQQPICYIVEIRGLLGRV